MTSRILNQIALDENGTAYIAGLPVRVTDIVRIKHQNHMSPEQIQAAVPIVSLSQVYAALDYYRTHRAAIDTAETRRSDEMEAVLSRLSSRNKPAAGQNWVSLIAGKWPGDETDAEIAAALERIS
jgi:uncharacterized protein (DUF433 family)